MSTRDTTHTVRYEAPHPLSAIPMNKWAQFLFGAFIIFVGIKMALAGWFSRELFGIEPVDPSDGVGNPVGLLPFLIDGVCFVGILGFAAVAFIRDLIGPVLAGMSDWVASASAENAAGIAAGATGAGSARESAGQAAEGTAKKRLDPEKTAMKFRLIQDAINTLHKRVVTLEEAHPELQPAPEPEPLTAEQLQAQVAELREQLAAVQQQKPATRTRSRRR